MSENTVLSKRNYGIDLLRIVSMFLVVLLHVLGQGGILGVAKEGSVNFKIAWLLETAAFCAANCYALISGYVGVGTRHKYANILNLYLEVVFYTVLVVLGFKYYMPDVLSEGVFIRALFPFVYNQYWYFTAYFCVFFFMPFMNKLLLSLNKNELRTLAITIFALFTLLPMFFACDVFSLGWGYSSLWIGALYLFGGCLKLLEAGKQKKAVYIGIYVFCVLVSWLNKFLLPYPKNAFLLNYISPTILLAAASLLIFFSKLTFRKWSIRLISFFSPLAFGVFLFHTHPYIWHHWLYNRYIGFIEFSPLKLALSVVLASLVIWFVCSIVDFIRHLLFKLFRIKKLCIAIENKIGKLTKRTEIH